MINWKKRKHLNTGIKIKEKKSRTDTHNYIRVQAAPTLSPTLKLLFTSHNLFTAIQSIQNKKNCMHIDLCSHSRFLTSLADHLYVLHHSRQHFTHLYNHYLVWTNIAQYFSIRQCILPNDRGSKNSGQLPTQDVTSSLPFVIQICSHYLVCTKKKI